MFATIVLLPLLFCAPAVSSSGDDVALARTDFEAGSYFRATDQLLAILEERPNDLEARALLLDSLSAEGRLDEADQQVIMLRAALAAMGAEAKETVGTTESPAAGGPPGPAATADVLRALGRYALRRGRLEDAARCADALLGADPADQEAAWLNVRMLLERGRHDDAREFVKAFIHRLNARRAGDAPGTASDAFYCTGRLYAAIGELDAASEHLVQAEALRKKEGRRTADVLVALGDVYRIGRQLDGGEQPRAFSTYRDALKENPSLVAAKVGRVRTHLFVSDQLDAEKELGEALAIDPNDVDALTLKAHLLTLDGRYDDALALLDRAIGVNPASRESRAERAAALHLLERTQDFESEEAAVLNQDPTYGEFYRIVGDAISSHYRFAEALPFQRKAIEVDPHDGNAWVSLGRDLCFDAKEKEGLEALRKAGELDPYPHPWRRNMIQVLEGFDASYVDHESGGFRFRIHADENPIMAPRLDAAFAADRKRLEDEYQWTPPKEVLVELIGTHTDFSVRTVGFAGLGAVGACFGPLVTLVSPRAEGLRQSFVWRRTVLHELTHVFTLGRSKARVPRWLTEGLSVYEESRAHGTWGRDMDLDLIDAVANDDVIPIEEFNAAFRTPRIGFAYYQGGLMAEFFVERYGFDKILALLDAYADDLQTAPAISRVFSRTPEQIDAEFLEWIHRTRIDGTRVQPTFTEATRRRLVEKLRKSQDDADLLVDLAWAYASAGRSVDSDVQLSRALKVAPTHPGALRLAARRALDRGRPDLARENLEAAFKNGGEEFNAAMLLAKLRAKDGEHEAARDALRVAIRCFPNYAGPNGPHMALFESLMAENRVDEAMKELTAFVALNETAVEPRTQLASWLDGEGRHEEALRYLREAEEIEPYARSIYRAQSEQLRALGRPADAIAVLRSALLVDPSMAPGYAPPKSADDEARQAEADREERADLLVTVAEIELEVGDSTSARRDLEAALRVYPGYERAVERIDSLQP